MLKAGDSTWLASANIRRWQQRPHQEGHAAHTESVSHCIWGWRGTGFLDLKFLPVELALPLLSIR